LGSHAAPSVISIAWEISSAAPPSRGTRIACPVTPRVPITHRPSGDTIGLPMPVPPGIGVPVSASSDWCTSWSAPWPFTTA